MTETAYEHHNIYLRQFIKIKKKNRNNKQQFLQHVLHSQVISSKRVKLANLTVELRASTDALTGGAEGTEKRKYNTSQLALLLTY
jgi:hypothetical protein